MSLLFNKIAPIYGLFYNYQISHYQKVVSGVKKEFNISDFNSVIDIGCGTGALVKVLAQQGLEVTGIDSAQKMLDIATRKVNDNKVNLLEASIVEPLPFSDKSFDLSIASYVAHGLSPEDRVLMYREMVRITKDYVIIYDYNANRSILTSFVEWMEQGDYFNFIKVVNTELEEIFSKINVINVGKRAAWYICEVNEIK